MPNFKTPINCNPFLSIVGYDISGGGLVFSLQEYDDDEDLAYIYDADGNFVESRSGVPRDNGDWANTSFALVRGNVLGIDGAGSLFDLYKNGIGWKTYTVGGLVNDISSSGGANPYLWLQSGSYTSLKIDAITGVQLDAFTLSTAGFDIIKSHRGSAAGLIVSANSWTEAPPPDLHWFERAVLWDSDGVEVAVIDELIYAVVADENSLIDDVAINSDRCAVVRRDVVTNVNAIKLCDLGGNLKDTITYTSGNATVLLMSENRIYAGDWGTGVVRMWDITDDGVGNKTYTSTGSFNTPSPFVAYGNLVV